MGDTLILEMEQEGKNAVESPESTHNGEDLVDYTGGGNLTPALRHATKVGRCSPIYQNSAKENILTHMILRLLLMTRGHTGVILRNAILIRSQRIWYESGTASVQLRILLPKQMSDIRRRSYISPVSSQLIFL